MTFHNQVTDLHGLAAGDIRVLYVDDDAQVLRSFNRIATRGGYDVTCVNDPSRALELVRTSVFHIIAADYGMPQMTGVEFFERLAPINPNPYKIMITGMMDFETAQAAINRAGVHRYVTKPYARPTMVSVLKHAEEHAQLVLQNELLRARLAQHNSELQAINKTLDRLVRARTLNVLNALVSALDYRDTETHWHSRRVALFARMIGAEMGLDAETLHDVEFGSLLHDVGKIGISDNILMKPGKLTEAEWVEMRKHPELGNKLLASIDFLDEARAIVLHHHERWDGAGYPGKLRETEIVLGARIFSVVDTLDAMTSDRPYRKKLSYEIAKEEIIRHSGSQFDPHVVEVFLAISDQRWKAALAAGHAHEDYGNGPELDRVLAESAEQLPEIAETLAWQRTRTTQ